MKRRRKNPFPGVHSAPDRHGKIRHRLKRIIEGRTIGCYLPSPYGGVEFRRAYEEAIEGVRVVGRRASAGTIGYLVEGYLSSAAYRDLAPSTRAGKRKRLDWIRETIGDARYTRLEPRHIEKLMEKKGGAEAANRLRKDLSQLFRFAAKRYAFKGQNPAMLADPRKIRSGGFHTWTDEEIAAYRATHPSGSKARLALELFLGTGAARQDAAALTCGNIRGNRLLYRRGKTEQEVDLPILPELARELAHLPATQMVLLAHESPGKSYAVAALGNAFRRWCNQADLPPRCSAHGLRKAGARRLAEHGASEYEVMSFLGHASAKEASRYTAAANRANLATSGMARLADENRNK